MRQNTDESQHDAALNYRDPAFSKHGSSPQLRLTFDINWINFSWQNIKLSTIGWVV